MTTRLEARAKAARLSGVTTVALVGDAAIQRTLTEVCEQWGCARFVTCERVSDLVMSVFGIEPDLAVLDALLVEDFAEAVVLQLRQASPEIEILIYGLHSPALMATLTRRGVHVVDQSQLAANVASLLNRAGHARPADNQRLPTGG